MPTYESFFIQGNLVLLILKFVDFLNDNYTLTIRAKTYTDYNSEIHKQSCIGITVLWLNN